MNILYVEDDRNIAELYTLMIQDYFEGVEVHHFMDGQKAIAELKENHSKYQMVISDFKLPNISGAEIFKFVSGQMLGIPFIILSGYDCSKDDNLNLFFNSHVRNALLTKPVTVDELVEKIKWCLESEADVLKIYQKEKSNFDEKIPINSEALLKINYLPCDVYLKINEGKFVKIINKKEIYEHHLIHKFVLKGVTQFYVNRSELSDYSNSVIGTLSMVIKTKRGKIDDTEKSQLTNKGLEVLKSNLLKCGFSENIMNATDQLIDLQLELIKSTPELDGFLEKFQNFRLAYTDHTRLISYVVVTILKDLEWDSESTLYRMTLAAMLHDLALPEELLKKTTSSAKIKLLSEEEQKIFYRHPEESAHMAKNFDFSGSGLEQFILEHHELPDGKGFPRKLNFNHVHPLSAVLHLADLVADLMWEHNFEVDKVKENLKERRNFYLRGFYRKPYEAIYRMFDLSKWS